MASSSRSLASSYTFDDKDLEDADLWAVIDSAAASLAQKNPTTTSTTSSSGKSSKPLAVRYPNFNSPPTPVSNAPPPSKLLLQVANHNNPRSHEESPRPSKIARSRVLCEVNRESSSSSPTALVTTTSHRSSNPIIHSTKFSSPESYYSPGIRQSTALPESPRPMALVTTANRDLTPVNHSTKFSSPESYLSPGIRQQQSTSLSEVFSPPSRNDPVNEMRHSLSGSFPSAALFKEYQNTAMAILEKSDYTMISGKAYIKKSGWRKISFYFNVSYEIRDKNIEFDENRNVQRAEFIVRAIMQGGRFADGWGSCERREKKFLKPNHDIPSTAETRAKNRACQDLLGIGEYRESSTGFPR
ncbi:cell wall protein RBR3 [Raphanus sativus]|uniref:Cell wall protein RBR3 n=1 Tax=Raphanus sativus TaxID=3726 RepID=A0A6J0NXB8_RAPSA|nr:cell wall protein RBR3 [Raphanus sativus]